MKSPCQTVHVCACLPNGAFPPPSSCHVKARRKRNEQQIICLYSIFTTQSDWIKLMFGTCGSEQLMLCLGWLPGWVFRRLKCEVQRILLSSVCSDCGWIEMSRDSHLPTSYPSHNPLLFSSVDEEKCVIVLVQFHRLASLYRAHILSLY